MVDKTIRLSFVITMFLFAIISSQGRPHVAAQRFPPWQVGATWGTILAAQEWPPRPPKNRQGTLSVGSPGPSTTTKGQGLRSPPFGNPPRLSCFRFFASSLHFVAGFRAREMKVALGQAAGISALYSLIIEYSAAAAQGEKRVVQTLAAGRKKDGIANFYPRYCITELGSLRLYRRGL